MPLSEARLLRSHKPGRSVHPGGLSLNNRHFYPFCFEKGSKIGSPGGGVNWGLVGAFDFNLVQTLFGNGSLSAIIYSLVGLSAIYMIYSSIKVGQTTSVMRTA